MFDPQLKGMFALTIMTIWNGVMGIVMVAGAVPVPEGMLVSFVGMGAICLFSMFWLMGGERPWGPTQYGVKP